MTIRRLILLLTCMAAIAILSACSSVNPNTITVALSTAPPGSLVIGATASVTATVTNDSRKEGVDWSVTCGAADCGSFSPVHTASGGATTFTAPPVIPDGFSVVITATSTRNPVKTATATTTITIAGFDNSSLTGNYVFEATGVDAFGGGLYHVAGVLTADGAGAITGGELTYVQFFIDDINVPITGGSYSVGADGRTTITLVTADNHIGPPPGGTITLGAVVASSSRALITQFDTSATSSGTMDLQTATINDPTGSYAFVVNGDDFFVPMAIGGVFNIDSTDTISGTGSVVDIDEGGSINAGGGIATPLTLTGDVVPPIRLGP